MGELQHATSGTVIYAELIHVLESDCAWRTADDNSELSFDWDVIRWRSLDGTTQAET